MRIKRLITALAVLAFLLSGCTSLSLNSSEILTPPKAAGTRAEIQSMIEQESNGSYSLIYPASGDFKSAITSYDLNRDGTDEVVALYSASDGSARVLTAKSDGSGYSFMSSLALSSANVSRLSFADINADGVYELLISCDDGSPISSLCAYTVGENAEKLSIAESYTDYVTGDIDGNSADDILVLTGASVEKGARASLYVCTDGTINEKSACESDSDIIYYPSVSYCTISDGIVGVASDGMTESGEYRTQLFYYDSASHSLLNPLYTSNVYSSTFRTQAVCCYDINGDDTVEIPLCSELPAISKDGSPKAASVAHWSNYQVSSGSLEETENTIIGTGFGFLLKTSPKAEDELTAAFTSDSSLTVYRKDGKSYTPALTVFCYPAESYDATLTAQAVIGQSGSYIYTYSLPDGSPYNHDAVVEAFIPFDI